jgi:hypothetical protein
VNGLPTRVGACLGQCPPLAVGGAMGTRRGCDGLQPSR